MAKTKVCPMCRGSGNWRGTGHCITCADSGEIPVDENTDWAGTGFQKRK